jgi:RNA polymerase sigma-70 factor (ECF subfamily)
MAEDDMTNGRPGHLRVVPGPAAPAARLDFPAVYREHHRFVFRILQVMGVPQPALEDTVQDVFLVVYRRQKDWDPATSIRSWLYGIARRVAAHVHRGHKRGERHLRALPAPEPTADASAHVARAEAVSLVADFIASLGEGQRLVFVLADVEAMSAPEIADIAGIPLNTVYSRLRAARRSFAARLARHHQEQRRP